MKTRFTSERGQDTPSQIHHREEHDTQRCCLYDMKVLESVPTFSPSEAEFADPFKYFGTLCEAGREYGILRIVTPEAWRPRAAPTTHSEFDSYRQAIHTLRTGRTFDTVSHSVPRFAPIQLQGDDYTVESYRAYAEGLTERWSQRQPDLQLDVVLHPLMTEDTQARFSARVEEAYWDMVEGRSGERLEVDYASNHPVLKSFPGGAWDLSSLYDQDGNLLKKVTGVIPGVTHPWVYYGCLFSTFCWHVEDHFMYSVNYLHSGADKIWYGIPSSGAEAFEKHLTASYSTRSRKSDVLNRLTLMLSPYAFPEDLPVFKAVQRAGDMILTFPRAFHGGYNEGWNCAEAVNFALQDWVWFGQQAVRHYHDYGGKKALFSHSRLLWKLMHERPHNGDLPMDLRRALRDACRHELEERAQIRSRLYNVKEAAPRQRWEIDWDEWSCATCQMPLFFSYVSCRCRVEKAAVLCLPHALESAAFLCCCAPFLCLETADNELNTMLKTVKYQTDNTKADG